MTNQKPSVKGTPVSSDSRLIGWLVSYAMNDRGTAYELRAGRYLVTSQDSDETRTISVQEETISSPHLAMNATNKHVLVVQDIFSEHGTYIVKADSGQEIPVTGPVAVNHGDWLRVGEKTRFQICLIDGPGR
jgi:hypothetical protein